VKDQKSKASGYRWLVLAVFMLITLVNQACWITFAPITGEAAQYYGTSDLMIGLLSLVFLVVYVLIVIPAAWLIDTLGFRRAVSIGAALTAAFAVLRWFFASSFAIVLISQVGIALGQPLVLGAITQLSARWFPVRERGTATGLGTLAIYLGVLAAMFLTPPLTAALTMKGMLLSYAAAAVAAAIFFIAAARDFPRQAATGAGQAERLGMFEGLKSMLRNRDFILLMIIFFIGITAGADVRSQLLAAPGCQFPVRFFLLNAGPTGFQYGAEIAQPAPEGPSNSLLLVMGQISGIVFILGMDAFLLRGHPGC